MTMLEGVYLPLVTPFYDGAVDTGSLRRLVEHYAGFGLAGLIMMGTTGESPTVETDEQRAVVAETIQAAAGRATVFAGVGGNSTRHVAAGIASYESLEVAGYLVVTPYYNRPRRTAWSRTTGPSPRRPNGRSSSTTFRTAPG